MRRIVVATFTSIDGVMQAPGGPEEDPSGGFEFGGWTVPHWDEVSGAAMGETFANPFDLLLGRRTYDIFAAHWAHVETDPSAPAFDEGAAGVADAFNRATKYVATHRPESLAWQNSQALGDDVVGRLRALKQEDGPDFLVQGSSELVHQLLPAGLVDIVKLLVFPVVLGKGKSLFGGGALPASFRVVNSLASPSGVVVTTYERSGHIETGSFALKTPSEAEQLRRETLR